MHKKIALLGLAGFLSLILTGCLVRTYTVTKERVDQDLTQGNRGYIFGKPKVSETKERKKTREVAIVEIEAHPPKIGFWQKPVGQEKAAPAPAEVVEIKPQAATTVVAPAVESSVLEPVKKEILKQYKVQKGDTLQKISMKFYGTTKRWKSIYEANKKILKSPDSIYPGQVIMVPVKEAKGIK